MPTVAPLWIRFLELAVHDTISIKPGAGEGNTVGGKDEEAAADEGGAASVPSQEELILAGRTKPCKVCALPIPYAARKCIRCGSFQYLSDRFGLSPTILSLLIALISTTVAAIPVLQSYARGDDSDIYLKFVSDMASGGGRKQIHLAAVNRGTKPGFIAEGRILHGGTEAAFMADESRRVSILVPPGQVVGVTYSVYVNRPVPVSPSQSRQTLRECTAEMNVVNFRANTTKSEFLVPCELLDVRPFSVRRAKVAGVSAEGGKPVPAGPPVAPVSNPRM